MRELIRRIGLPPLADISVETVLEHVVRDKKARESGLSWVYPRRLGEGHIDSSVPMDEVRELLSRFLPDPWG